jgi:hypothetical protein
VGDFGFVVHGNNSGTTTIQKGFRYHAPTDSWKAVYVVNGNNQGVSGVVNGKAYLGTGYSGSTSWREYCPDLLLP